MHYGRNGSNLGYLMSCLPTVDHNLFERKENDCFARSLAIELIIARNQAERAPFSYCADSLEYLRLEQK